MNILRHQPYRLFFPLGAFLSVLGVGYWLLFSLSTVSAYLPRGHALSMNQGFLLSIGCGFLLTMIPRRTKTEPAGVPFLLILAGCLAVSGTTALTGPALLGELSFLAALTMLIAFAVSRLRRSEGEGQPPPDSFVLIPIGLGWALIGGVTLCMTQALDLMSVQAVAIAQGLITQAMFLCLVIGVGSMFLPVLVGRAPSPDLPRSETPVVAHPARKRLAFAVAGLIIGGSFVAQSIPSEFGAWTRMGDGLRFVVVLAGTIIGMNGLRLPGLPGTQRRLAWCGAWCVPLGLGLATLLPDHRAGMLHVTFIGGFGLMALAVAAHVSLAHGTEPARRDQTSWALRIFGTLLLIAMATRAAASYTGDGYMMHLGVAAGVWLAALVPWFACLRRPLVVLPNESP